MLNAIDWAERGLLPDALIRWASAVSIAGVCGKSEVPTEPRLRFN